MGILAAPQAFSQGFSDEIQVYAADLQKPGRWGLEVHFNSILKGLPGAGAEGNRFERAVNFTPEFSWGLAGDIDVGLYLANSLDREGRARFAGPKLRAKWLPVRPRGQDETGAFLGVNAELGRLRGPFADSRTAFELRGIAGHQSGTWLFAVNPFLSWPLSDGLRRGSPDFSTGWKASWRGWKGLEPGLEYYADHGTLRRLDALSLQPQTLFVTLDGGLGPWGFNLGAGRGLNANTDRWTLKLILEVPF